MEPLKEGMREGENKTQLNASHVRPITDHSYSKGKGGKRGHRSYGSLPK